MSNFAELAELAMDYERRLRDAEFVLKTYDSMKQQQPSMSPEIAIEHLRAALGYPKPKV